MRVFPLCMCVCVCVYFFALCYLQYLLLRYQGMFLMLLVGTSLITGHCVVETATQLPSTSYYLLTE
jgi:hypothetical protein